MPAPGLDLAGIIGVYQRHGSVAHLGVVDPCARGFDRALVVDGIAGANVERSGVVVAVGIAQGVAQDRVGAGARRLDAVVLHAGHPLVVGVLVGFALGKLDQRPQVAGAGRALIGEDLLLHGEQRRGVVGATRAAEGLGTIGLVEDLTSGAICGDALKDGQANRECRDVRHDLPVGHTDAEAIGANGEWRGDGQDAGIAIDRHAGWSTRESIGIGVAKFIAAPCDNIANATRLER